MTEDNSNHPTKSSATTRNTQPFRLVHGYLILPGSTKRQIFAQLGNKLQPAIQETFN